MSERERDIDAAMETASNSRVAASEFRQFWAPEGTRPIDMLNTLAMGYKP